MLTKKDLELIGEVINQTVPTIVERIVEPKFEEFAILIQNEFRVIHSILETKADKADLETKADKTDILRLENKFEGRIERIEDDIRIVKTKLKIA